MSGKICAVCGKELLPQEVKMNEMSRRTVSRKKKYLCSRCRKIDYEQYVKAVKELIEKR